MYTIGRLAKKYHLSRSTLLYYDSIGLLRPSSRTDGSYRVYSEEDARRLEQICTYRAAGVRLAEIGRVLDSSENELVSVLEQRLEELNDDIERLRQQQHLIIGLLKNSELFERMGVMSKETWVSLLLASGFSEQDMHRWHVEFEHLSPEKHLRFLKFLCVPEEEIRIIRSWAGAQVGVMQSLDKT
ncbi:MAG: MerR family transcriptional regulator [Desulfomonile tiedjei]|uniref:MerR family transcriptional regulator n=1 Tax=Desulfomonile tiedjei TaxID=2358 RepID=A0A9D6V1K9_9BACT|nr:MerR family transcriptional regulator [Desulfomonile tiedjei]